MELAASGRDALLLWDESVLEKPESVELCGLGSVRSSKAARLKHIKPGPYTPPGGPPVFVPRLNWCQKQAWEITRGKRFQDWRLVPTRGGKMARHAVLAMPVRHAEHRDPLWLVVGRPGSGHPPLNLLTNEPAHAVEQAWTVVFAYARRWQIEMGFRFGKSELAMQSPRLWFVSSRNKLLQMASLAHAFLLSLLQPENKHLGDDLLDHFWHRTGKRSRHSPAPLYRFRSALAYLWNRFFNPAPPLLQNTG